MYGVQCSKRLWLHKNLKVERDIGGGCGEEAKRVVSKMKWKSGGIQNGHPVKMYYSLKVSLENGVIEEWQLWKKGKRLIRKPSAPQPELVFVPS